MLFCFTSSPSSKRRHLPLIRPLRKAAEDIHQLIDGRAQEADDGLVGRLVRGRGVGARGHEQLGALEAVDELLRVVLLQRGVEGRQVVLFLFFDVLGEGGPEGFEGRIEVGVAGGEALEFVELFFDLEESRAC